MEWTIEKINNNLRTLKTAEWQNVKDENGDTALLWAIRNSHADYIAKLYLRYNGYKPFIKITARTSDGLNEAHLAIKIGNIDVIYEIIDVMELRLGFNEFTDDGIDSLTLALRENHYNIAEILLHPDLNYEINKSNTPGGKTPLFNCIEDKNIPAIKFLIEKGSICRKEDLQAAESYKLDNPEIYQLLEATHYTNPLIEAATIKCSYTIYRGYNNEPQKSIKAAFKIRFMEAHIKTLECNYCFTNQENNIISSAEDKKESADFLSLTTDIINSPSGMTMDTPVILGGEDTHVADNA